MLVQMAIADADMGTLSGADDLRSRRNSQTGVVEAVSTATSNWGGLNADLHVSKESS